MKDRNTQAGVSYYDVAIAMKEAGRTHHGRVSFHLTLPVREVRGIALDIRVVFHGGIGALTGSKMERGVSGVFPTVRSRTLAGELLRLVYELDWQLTDEREKAQRSEQGRFGW